MPASEVPESISVQWPVGPLYDYGQAGSSDAAKWVAFKLGSAIWYIDRLREIASTLGTRSFDRFVGVEMALDGALASLCGAADCAMFDLTTSTRQRAGLPALKEHLTNWPECQQALNTFLRTNKDPDATAALKSIDGALEGHKLDQPIGFLVALQRLRNRSIHQNTLARNWNVGLGPDHSDVTVQLMVSGPNGVNPEDPVMYLERSFTQVKKLCEEMLTASAGTPIQQVIQSATVFPPPATGSAVAVPPGVAGPGADKMGSVDSGEFTIEREV